MTAAIKTRLDAIDEQMAELQKEQAKLREELDKPDFVPGWYIAWDSAFPDDKEETPTLFYFACNSDKSDAVEAYLHVVPFTPALAARFFPKTRYDWAKIVKEHPEAKWASTDESGRVDAWETKPTIRSDCWDGGELVRAGGIFCGEDTPDWRDSLEARPEGI